LRFEAGSFLVFFHRRTKTADRIVDNFFGGRFAPGKAPFLPFRKAKTALALAPEGVRPPNVKMGMTICAGFLPFFDTISIPF